AARTLGGACRSDISRGGNDIHAHGDKFSRKRRQCIIVAAGPPLLNTKISALNETGLGQPLSKRVSIETISIGRGAVQEAYERHPLLLRARRRGPARGATQQRDERAPRDHSITSSAVCRNGSGMVRPSAFAVLRLMTSSYLVGCWTGRSLALAPLRIRST